MPTKVNQKSCFGYRPKDITFVFLWLLLGYSAVVEAVDRPVILDHDSFFGYELFMNHGTIMWLIDPSTGIIIDANRRAQEYYGYPDLIGMNISDINPISREKMQKEVLELAAAGQRNFFSLLHRLADGRIINVEVSSYPITLDGREILFSIMQDVTARVEAERKARVRFVLIMALLLLALVVQSIMVLFLTRSNLRRRRAESVMLKAKLETEAVNAELKRLATTDTLTGVYNRRYFEDVIAVEVKRAGRYGDAVSLLLLDIDHFKSINDVHGHLVGDQILIGLTARVGEHLRSTDVLARWGGEEFVVLLPHTNVLQALPLAEKLRALIAETPFPVAGRVTASFGISEYHAPETIHAWMKRADEALYQAKALGRNRVQYVMQEANIT